MNLLIKKTKNTTISRKILAEEIVRKIKISLPEIIDGFISDYDIEETSFSLMFEIKEDEQRRMLISRKGIKPVVNKARAIIQKFKKEYKGKFSIQIKYIDAPKKIYNSYKEPIVYNTSFMTIAITIR